MTSQHLPSHDALHRLGNAIARLGGDADYVAHALADHLLSLRPVSNEELTDQEAQYLVESGAFTSDKLTAARGNVRRGSLQLHDAEFFLSSLCSTMSLERVSAYLNWDESVVRTAIDDVRLHAVEISGRLRIPIWQLNIGSATKLLPGLDPLIKVATNRWDNWRALAAFMSTPQQSLVDVGRQTPAEWLRRGGDVNSVRKIIEPGDSW